MDAEVITVPRPPLEVRGDARFQRPVPRVLEPTPNGLADRFSRTFGPRNPIRVVVVALLAGYALLVTAMVFFGLVLIHLLLPLGGLGEADEDLSRWLADNRSPTQEDISWVGSTLAGGLVIPAVIGVCLVTFLLMRRWLLAAFVLFVVAVESATYRVTSMIVERQRPDVPRLESLPVDASYPGGRRVRDRVRSSRRGRRLKLARRPLVRIDEHATPSEQVVRWPWTADMRFTGSAPKGPRCTSTYSQSWRRVAARYRASNRNLA